MRAERRALRLLAALAALAASGVACGMRGGVVVRASGPASTSDGGADGGAPEVGGDGPASETPPVLVTTYFLSPTGADTNPGTEAAPWKTFAHALPLLAPGLTLVLLDGTYTGATTGYLRAFCAPAMGTGAMANVVIAPMNALSGLPDQPITIRAQNERRAFFKGDGTGPPVELSACMWWTLEGLRAEGADVAGEPGDEPGSVVVLARGSGNVVLRRLLAAHPNRTVLASVYVLAHAAPGVLVEECEAVDFHYYGFHAFDSTRPVFRRDYAHSRDVPDLVGGIATISPALGDGGFLLTKSKGAIIENCVAERVGDGFTIAANRSNAGGRVQPQFDQILGSIANDVTHAGFVVASHCAGARPCEQGDQLVSDPLLSNNVSRGGALGFWSTGGVRVQIENASVFDVTEAGILFSIEPENAGLTSSAFGRASLVSAKSTVGYRSAGYVDWSFARCNAFGPTTAFVPRDGHVVDATEVDPQLGGCLLTVLPGSPLEVGGVGARLAFRYEEGQLTAEKLWDSGTGAFPCGASVPGVNDLAARADVSCAGLAARLHVGVMPCPIP